MQFVIGVLVLGAIIAFHEFGHFIAAKLCGIGVMEYALGMGPVLLWKRMGETVYSLRAIPIGGFCAMYGEQAMESSVQDGEGKKGRRRPDFKLDWEESRSYIRHPKWHQVIVALAGPGANLLMAFLAAVVLACLPTSLLGNPEVIGLGPVPVAERAGVEVGDVIVRIDDRNICMSQEYSVYLATHPKAAEEGYTLRVYRPSDGLYHEFPLVPDKETGLVGITHRGTDLPGVAGALSGGWRIVRNSVLMSYDSLAMLFRGDAKVSDMTGVVGLTVSIGDTVNEAAQVQQEGTEDGSDTAVLQAVLSMVVFISVGLAVMNMLPLPALDGGRALISAGEGIFRRSMPERVALCINGCCMLALFVLMGVVLVADLVRLFGNMG